MAHRASERFDVLQRDRPTNSFEPMMEQLLDVAKSAFLKGYMKGWIEARP